MKTLWNGTLELGELTIPVGLVSTVSERREKLKTLHRDCLTPAAQRGFCERDQEILDESTIVHAWEAAPGEYLLVDADERVALDPVESRRVAIGAFVPVDDLEPELLRKRYELVPSKTTVGRRGYRLLASAIHELQVAGLARFVAWRSEQLAAITSRDGEVMQLTTLYFAEDLLARPSLDPVDEVGDGLQELARELVSRHTRPLRSGDLDSVERPRVRALLDAKLAGQPIIRPAVEENERAPLASLDLEAALKRSLKKAPRRRGRRAAAATAG